MKLKRFLAIALGILMLVPLALTAFAYSSPYQSLQVSEAATSRFTISGSSANFDLFGSGSQAPKTKTATFSLTDASGAWHLSNSGTSNTAYTTSALGSVNTSNQYSNFVSSTAGMTFDLYAKFVTLPTLAANSVMKDSGAPAKNPSNLYFSGLVFDLCSAEKYMADTSKSNNEMQAVFASYANATTGTDSVLILPHGNRNGWASNSSAITYFFNKPSDYARYTLTFDPVAKTTQFFINGVAQKAAGDSTTTHGAIGLSYRATATTNFLNINLNNVQTSCVSGSKTDFYLDQLNVYPTALVPNGTNFGFEGDPVPAVENSQMKNALALYNDLAPYATDYINPTFWNAFKAWIDYCYDIVEGGGEQSDLDAVCTGISGNWFINRMTWLTTAGAEATVGGSDVTVAGTGTVLPAATPIVIGTDRIWISHSAYQGRLDAYGLNNSSILLTRAGMRMSDYAAYDLAYCMALSPEWRAYVCEPTTLDGIYKVADVGFNRDATVPEGGFILAFHADGVANGSVLSSGFSSVLFGDRNERAMKACQIVKGDYVKLEGVTINPDSAATLDTEGTWYCLDDPRITAPTTVTRNKNGVNEYFNGFKTNAYMVEVPAADVKEDGTLTLSVEGLGNVSYAGETFSGKKTFDLAIGTDITVNAEGENFLYWKNAKNGATLSTDREFSFNFGVSPLEIIAVFAEETVQPEYCTVTFKDALTGKILGTAEVEKGSVVPAEMIPEITAHYGYVFDNWYANIKLGDITTYTVQGNVTFFARYKNDETAFFNLTIVDGEKNETRRVRYAKTVYVTAENDAFSNWTLDGTFYSSAKTVQLTMPNADCTLATVNNGAIEVEPSIRFVANFVDDAGALMSTFARDIPEGYELLESGILLSRKAAREELVVDTVNRTVTKGVSTVSNEYNVFGFVKSDISTKAGTWFVRGYICIKTADGFDTYYTDIETVVIEGEGATQRKVSFVAMSHNVKNDDLLFADMAEHAQEENADVIGFQEVVDLADLSAEMEKVGYACYSGQRRGTSSLFSANEYNPIYYKTARFRIHNGGTFWLSDTPDVQSKLDGLRHHRICTWVVLEDRETGKFIQYFNTHLCATANSEGLDSSTNMNSYRFQQVKILLTQIELIAQNCPPGVRNVMLGGDFNMTDTNGVFKYLTGSAAYNNETNTITGSRLRCSKSVADITVPNDYGNYYTMLEDGVPKYAFDHLLVDIGGFDVSEFSVCSRSIGSDHLPVCVTMTEK